MNVLIVKTSSMGDIVHTLPALTDASTINHDIVFDWVVEEHFACIPSWHPAVNRVIPIAWRQWRRNLGAKSVRQAIANFYTNLRCKRYDAIIDAQGLIKSAVITRMAQGPRYGYDRSSAREAWASFGYQHRVAVSRSLHAVTRIRQLVAHALAYPCLQSAPDYGLRLPSQQSVHTQHKNIVFLHGTTWRNKQWPVQRWQDLARLVTRAGYHVNICWGNEEERVRSAAIANVSVNCEVLPRLDIAGVANVLLEANAVVAVDTGFAHLATALNVPVISLYGPTSPDLSGTFGVKQQALAADFACAPCGKRTCSYRDKTPLMPACLASIRAEHVWSQLRNLLPLQHEKLAERPFLVVE